MIQVDPREPIRIARKRWRWTQKRVRKLIRALPKYRKQARRNVYRHWNKRRRLTYASRLDRVPSREELPALLNRRGLVGRAAEIGVKGGKYSEFLLGRWKGERLISIDPWMEDSQETYVDRANVAQAHHELFYEQTKERLRKYGPRSEIWRMTSAEAAELVPDGSLDFVYIDARHDYESVLEDLRAWFPKIRPGGIMSGHDYATGHFAQGDFGVKRAVDEFFAARQLPVYATEGRSPAELFASWLIEIPGTLGALGLHQSQAESAAAPPAG